MLESLKLVKNQPAASYKLMYICKYLKKYVTLNMYMHVFKEIYNI